MCIRDSAELDPVPTPRLQCQTRGQGGPLFRNPLHRQPETGPQILRFQVADEADFGKVDHLGREFGTVVEELERGPVLRAQAEQVDAEFDGGRGGGHGERGSGRHSQKAASGQFHFARSIQQAGAVCMALCLRCRSKVEMSYSQQSRNVLFCEPSAKPSPAIPSSQEFLSRRGLAPSRPPAFAPEGSLDGWPRCKTMLME